MSEDNQKTHMTLFPESQQLNRTNWVEWKSRIQLILLAKGLLGHINGTEPAPTPSGTTITVEATAALAKWRKDNVIAKTTIMLNMTDLTGCGINPIAMSAAEFWNGLVSMRERRSKLAVINAEEYLKACKYVPGTDLNAHFDEMW